MIHGPCGSQNPSSPCMDTDKNICKKNFPKPFCNETSYTTNAYPTYRRHDNGKSISYGKKEKRTANNGYVVPYNVYLLLKYNCHINVEICTMVLAVKYLFKYCFKGHDCARIKISNADVFPSDNCANINNNTRLNYDEITQYLDTRYVFPPESIYRIFTYDLNRLSHVIYRLAVHLEGEQNIYFEEGHEQECVDKYKDSTLTAWFKLNTLSINARHYLYSEIPLHYVVDNREKKWNQRQKFIRPVSCRLYFVSPKEQERYFLRLLLLNVPGATSFASLRTVNGTTCSTLKKPLLHIIWLKLMTNGNIVLEKLDAINSRTRYVNFLHLFAFFTILQTLNIYLTNLRKTFFIRQLTQ